MSIIQVGVKALILSSDLNHFLALKRNPEKSLIMKEVFDIPGGRIDFGEEPISGLRRECQEEINYTFSADPILLDAANIFLTEDRQIIRLTYIITENIETSAIRLGDEHVHAQMLSLEESDDFHPILNKAIRKAKRVI